MSAAGQRVYMTPDYRGVNPYQELLRRALAPLGVETVFPRGYRRGLPLLRGLLAAGPTTAVHLHWLSPWLKRYPGWWGTWFGALRLAAELLVTQRLLGRRLVWTVHNLESHEGGDQPGERWLRRWLGRTADALIVHTEDARQRVAERYRCPEAKIHVIRHGHYDGHYGLAPEAQTARQQLGLPSAAVIFLFLGMLRPYKGLADLLAAWRERPSGEAVLVLAGDPQGAAGPPWEPPALPGLECRLGRVPDEALPAWLAACDYFVLPIRNVLTSGSLVLAASYGVPVIAPRYPMVVEVAGDGPLLYDPQDPAGLGRAMAQAVAAGRRPSRSLVAPASPRTEWAGVALQTAALYRGPSGRAA